MGECSKKREERVSGKGKELVGDNGVSESGRLINEVDGSGKNKGEKRLDERVSEWVS